MAVVEPAGAEPFEEPVAAFEVDAEPAAHGGVTGVQAAVNGERGTLPTSALPYPVPVRVGGADPLRLDDPGPAPAGQLDRRVDPDRTGEGGGVTALVSLDPLEVAPQHLGRPAAAKNAAAGLCWSS